MRVRDTIREFVRRTEKRPFLGHMYRTLYHGAAALVTLYIRSQPDFDGIYLRGSYARGDFEPGRSDLDFVFVTRDALEDQQLYDLLERTRRRFSAMKSVVPFLGEFEVLEKDTLPCWLQSSPDRNELRPPGKASPFRLAPPGRRELVRKGLADFVYMWWPNLPLWGQPELDRLYDKITRLCGFTTPDIPYGAERRWHQTTSLLRSFQDTCCRFSPPRGSAQIYPNECVALPQPLKQHQARIRTYVESRFDENDCFLVLDPSRISPDSIADFRSFPASPVPFTPESLKFYLAYVAPLHAISLQKDRKTWGEDIEGALSMDESSLRIGMVASASAVLSYVLTNPVEPELAELHLLGWYLRFKRYFEDGVREVYFHEILEGYREKDPTFHRLLVETLERPNPPTLFSLYRQIARDISRAISQIETEALVSAAR